MTELSFKATKTMSVKVCFYMTELSREVKNKILKACCKMAELSFKTQDTMCYNVCV